MHSKSHYQSLMPSSSQTQPRDAHSNMLGRIWLVGHLLKKCCPPINHHVRSKGLLLYLQKIYRDCHRAFYRARVRFCRWQDVADVEVCMSGRNQSNCLSRCWVGVCLCVFVKGWVGECCIEVGICRCIVPNGVVHIKTKQTLLCLFCLQHEPFMNHQYFPCI